jgi:hypothetical protein
MSTTHAQREIKRPSPAQRPQDPVARFIARRVAAAQTSDGPSERFMKSFQKPIWDFLCDHYFRLEIDGWHRIPDEPSLLIGIHGGGSLTMDAWTLVHAWYRYFEGERVLHGTAHDVLMASPGLGDYFKAVGVIPASRTGVTAALAAGHDVIVWPGGEQDAMRSWRKRDKAVLAGRKGFVRQAIRSGVPIGPWRRSADTTPSSSCPRGACSRAGRGSASACGAPPSRSSRASRSRSRSRSCRRTSRCRRRSARSSWIP